MVTQRSDAGTLLDLLANRHAGDVFVAECKTGSSWSGARRLDAWAMLKTWSPWTTIGYEIKVSRSDFLQDRKWHEYLPVCHEMYFVCPPKLIAVEELPQDVGLLWPVGLRLTTKRKAVRREPDPVKLLELMSYVLMSRTRIVGDMHEANRADPADYWRLWLALKGNNLSLGQEVSARIREIVKEARSRASNAEDATRRLTHVEARLKELGLHEGTATWELDQKFTLAKNDERLSRVRRLAEDMLRLTQEPA